jgi:hypothetical protein
MAYFALTPGRNALLQALYAGEITPRQFKLRMKKLIAKFKYENRELIEQENLKRQNIAAEARA